jgi:membrane protein implicated in regulation of membrane protease activity
MEPLASLAGLNCLYFACLAIGGTYATIIMLTGALHDIHLPHIDFGGSAHVDLTPSHDFSALNDGNVKVPALSPITIASFITAFGAFGIISGQLFAATSPFSLVWATGAGIIVAVIAHFAFGYFLIAPQGSSNIRDSDVVGAEAVVITPIPSDAVGEIALNARGSRLTYPAHSDTGLPVARDTRVVVVRLLSNAAWVRPIEK